MMHFVSIALYAIEVGSDVDKCCSMFYIVYKYHLYTIYATKDRQDIHFNWMLSTTAVAVHSSQG